MIYSPHAYQEIATKHIIEHPAAMLMLEMGLGKTVSTLTAIDLLRYDYLEAGKVLVIAPLRVAEDTWARECAKWDHLRHLRISKVLGSAKHRRSALREEADLYLINRENVPWLVAEYGLKWPFRTVVIDEMSSFKSHDAKRFRALRKVRKHIDRIIGLTGTPAPNSLIDLWSQYYLLDEGARLGSTIGFYRDRYFTPGRRNGHIVYDWRAKQESEERIYEAISDITVSMKSEDWLDLPESFTVTKDVELSPETYQTYKRLERDYVLPYLDTEIVATSAAVLSNKLLQLASGAVYDESKEVVEIHDAKLDALEDLVESAVGNPVMVFYNYKHSLERIQRRFREARTLRKGESGVQDIADWNANKIPILLVHPKSAGHGLNLQESRCQALIWFDQIWSLEEYLQANARVIRQGQKHSVVVYHLVVKGSLDYDVIKALENKKVSQDELLEAVKARVEGVRNGRNPTSTEVDL